MKTLKKLIRLIKTNTNDILDKAYDPISDLKQSKRDLDTEINNMIDRSVKVKTRIKGMKRSQQDNMERANEQLEKARECKGNGDLEGAKRYAERHLRLMKMVDQYAQMVESQKSHDKRLVEVVRELEVKKDDLDFELEMLEVRKDVADANIHYHENINGTTNNSESIKEAIEKARKTVDGLQDKSEALDEVNQEFSKDETSKKVNVSSDVQNLVDSL